MIRQATDLRLPATKVERLKMMLKRASSEASSVRGTANGEKKLKARPVSMPRFTFLEDSDG
jgi:hypothetical protein